LTGNLPSLSNISPSLEAILANSNALCGPLPTTIPASLSIVAIAGNHWDCPLPSWCVPGRCEGAGPVCETTPYGSCAAIIIGGDPHGWDSQGNPFELPSIENQQIVYRVFRDSQMELIVSVEASFVRDIQVIDLSEGTVLFHGKLNSALEPEFYWKQELLAVPVAFSDFGREISAFFIDEVYADNQPAGMNELRRYQTIGIHVDSIIRVVAGLHPQIGGFFNFKTLPDPFISHGDSEFPSVVQLLHSFIPSHLRSETDWNNIFAPAIIPNIQ